MGALLYREDFDEVRDRLTTWWRGGDIGRPAMHITVPRVEPLERIHPLPEPEGWVTHYSTRDFGYRVNLAARTCVHSHYLADAVPQVAPDLAPNCLALYLGCRGVEMPGTVWCEPCLPGPDAVALAVDRDNFYWDFTLRLAREQLHLGQGKFMVAFPDLIEGLDTLAALRGTEELLVDLLERPEWVRGMLTQITGLYFHYYDTLYDMIRDERGGSHFWAWAPGRMAKFQCDFAAMISPAMFADFMVPVLREMTGRVDHCMFHWDGPGAIVHHDHLLALPDLDMLQWTPGAGVQSISHKRWWPLYRKTVEAGKKVALLGFAGLDNLVALRRELGDGLKQCLIAMRADSLDQADEILHLVSD